MNRDRFVMFINNAKGRFKMHQKTVPLETNPYSISVGQEIARYLTLCKATCIKPSPNHPQINFTKYQDFSQLDNKPGTEISAQSLQTKLTIKKGRSLCSS